MTDNNEILKQLNRAKALAQAQALCSAMGLNPALVRYATPEETEQITSQPETQTDLSAKKDEK